MKILTNISSFLILILLSFSAFSNDYCQPASGHPDDLHYDFGNYNITDPAENTVGTTVPEKSLQASGSSLQLSCDCDVSGSQNIYVFGDTTLNSAEKIGDYNYLDMPNNEYMQVGVNIYTTKNGYVSVPFTTGSSASGKHSCGTFTIKTGGTNTGSGIKVSLRIKKPFIGSSLISPVIIASTYWTIIDKNSHGTVPTTNIYLSGSITVPQNCVINTGTQIAVELGQFYSGDFNTIGQKPEGFSPKTFNVPIQCNDISATANLTLRLQGTASTGVTNALQSDNKDVGVVVTTEDGSPLIPNDSSSVIPFQLDDSNRANVTLHAYPVGTTGNTPEVGQFTTLAYLRVDFS